jgi:anti-anti-sigma factor
VPPDFRLTSAYLGRHAYVVTVSGELDVATVPGLGEEFARVLNDGAQEVVVDLLGVPFVDSVALGLLVETSRRMAARGGAFRIVCDDRRIVRIIEVTGLDRVLLCHSTLRDALESIDGFPLPKAAAG